ncbi:MAG: hypothetical protein LBK50_00245 [Candidatus Nomurabacteria bacterium]|jgi:hypothetical protein|nr:hypothetical protein [Candidatus Nomurabacteria bacterium]
MMGRDVSLILAPQESMRKIVEVSKNSGDVNSLLSIVGDKKPDGNNFEDYLQWLLDDERFKNTTNFNVCVGFGASLLLASIYPAWYFRNCSVSDFFDKYEAVFDRKDFISDWSTIVGDVIPDAIITNNFGDVNFSLGALMSPENCQNFLTAYGGQPDFSEKVNKFFGIFTAGLIEALGSSVKNNVSLIESTDIFGNSSPPVPTKQYAISNQRCYSIDTYSKVNIALQAFSCQVGLFNAHIRLKKARGEIDAANTIGQDNEVLIGVLVEKGNAYVDEVRKKTSVNVPYLTKDMWDNVARQMSPDAITKTAKFTLSLSDSMAGAMTKTAKYLQELSQTGKMDILRKHPYGKLQISNPMGNKFELDLFGKLKNKVFFVPYFILYDNALGKYAAVLFERNSDSEKVFNVWAGRAFPSQTLRKGIYKELVDTMGYNGSANDFEIFPFADALEFITDKAGNYIPRISLMIAITKGGFDKNTVMGAKIVIEKLS